MTGTGTGSGGPGSRRAPGVAGDTVRPDWACISSWWS